MIFTSCSIRRESKILHDLNDNMSSYDTLIIVTPLEFFDEYKKLYPKATLVETKLGIMNARNSLVKFLEQEKNPIWCLDDDIIRYDMSKYYSPYSKDKSFYSLLKELEDEYIKQNFDAVTIKGTNNFFHTSLKKLAEQNKLKRFSIFPNISIFFSWFKEPPRSILTKEVWENVLYLIEKLEQNKLVVQERFVVFLEKKNNSTWVSNSEGGQKEKIQLEFQERTDNMNSILPHYLQGYNFSKGEDWTKTGEKFSVKRYEIPKEYQRQYKQRMQEKMNEKPTEFKWGKTN